MATRSERIRVMYVDDDPWQLEASKLLFEVENDIQVSWCSSLDEALELCNEFDCVVTDYRMQKMSGVELVKEIRGISNVPVIIYSMYDEPAVANATMAAGANGFVLNDPLRGSHRRLTEEIRRLVHR